MPKMIQLRRVPDEVYTAIKARAAEQELSMSDYLVRELTIRFGPPADEELRGQKL
ncbi:MAG TPA: hypothetical protein VLM42_15360 [Bryobacteraceae bacterium]|nr:hypothetical protein [Bryobacteraceae bacterium]